jgi:hypothetical protein
MANRFSEMLKEATNGDASQSKRKKTSIDFGAALEGDESVSSVFKALRESDENTVPVIPTSSRVLPTESDKEASVSSGRNKIIEDVETDQSVASSPMGGTNIHPSIQSSKDTTIHPSMTTIRPVIQSDIQSTGHLSDHPSIQPYNQPLAHPSSQPSIQPSNVRNIYAPLTQAQGKVLLFLFERCAGFSNVESVSYGAEVPVGTVKDGLRALIKYGYITSKWRIVQHDFHGFGFTLNHQICSDYVSRVNNGITQPSIHPIGHPSNHPSFRPSVHSSIPISSSRNITSTTDIINLSDPELLYWAEEGVSQKRIQQWILETGMTPEQLELSLRYARYDILQRGDVRQPMDWFYTEIKRHGLYKKPSGYKSILETRLEEERQALDDIKRQAEELAALRKQREEASLELEFQNILSKPDSPEYKELLGQLGEFEKGTKGKILEFSLMRVFKISRGYDV